MLSGLPCFSSLRYACYRKYFICHIIFRNFQATFFSVSFSHVQSYMEDHLQNKDRLDKEWEALCSYQAEPAACAVGQEEQNVQRNHPHGILVCECFANYICLKLIYICFLVHYVVEQQHGMSQANAFCLD